MATSASFNDSAGVTSGRDAAGVILVATGVLVGFYYLGRADVIGVLRQGIWRPMTATPLQVYRHFTLSAFLLAVIPTVVARGILRLPLAELGLGRGRWRAGLGILALGLPLAVLAGWVGASSPAVRAVYPLDPALALHGFVPHALAQGLYFVSWEVLFRGVLLFGLAPRFGARPANAIQTALSVLAHFGRPLDEVLAAIPAGYLFGAVDLRLRSVWYVAFLHWVEGVALNYFILVR